MTPVDWAIVVVVAVSGLISLTRGFVKEALSLAVWVTAFLIARMFSANLATLLVEYIDANSVRWVISFVALFLATLAVGSMVTHLIVEVVRLTGLSGTDRVLGMIFGAIRGLVILVAVVYGLQYTMVPQDSWWQESMIIPHLELVADWARNTLPGA
ncbi:MAG: CvpA family protein, partial [Oceanobacter sp.]